MTESVGKRRLKDSKVFTWQGGLHSGREENDSQQTNLPRDGGRGGRKGDVTLLFNWLVVDETHGVLVLDDPFDELSLGEALCRGNEAKRDESEAVLRPGRVHLTKARMTQA